jgi:hypothetical protein
MATPAFWSCSAREAGSSRERSRSSAVDIANEIAVNDMPADDRKRVYRKELLLASAMVAAGLVISGLSLAELAATKPPQMAQVTPPLQSSPPDAQKKDEPAEPKPGGDRPTTPAPEPARPDADAKKSGAPTALPPAPAEKTAPPIKERQ